MEELKRKIVALIGMMDGRRDLDFICLAFQEVPRGDVAVAVLELCLDGGLVIDESGISLPTAAGDESAAPAEPAPATDEPEGPSEDVEEPATEDEKADDDGFLPELLPDVKYPASTIGAADSVDDLGLSSRPSNCLMRLGITTVAQLVSKLSGLDGQPGMGPGTLSEIKRSLAVRSASFTAPLGRRTADELRHVSGDREYVFDALGVLVRLSEEDAHASNGLSSQMHDLVDLGLGDAISRRLRANGFSCVEDLLRVSPASLAAVPHLGYGSVAKIRDAILAFCSRSALDAGAWADGQVSGASVFALLEAGGPRLAACVESVEDACGQMSYPVYEGSLRVLAAEFAWQRLCDGGNADEAAGEFVRRIGRSDALGCICLNDLIGRCRRALPEGRLARVDVPDAQPWLGLAAQLTSVDGIKTVFDTDGHVLRFEFKDVPEWLGSLDDARGARLVRQRLEGKTLQEIGDAEGLTRERVRQVTEVTLKRACPLKEDEWRTFFDAYDLSRDQFAAITGLGELSFAYLSLRAESKKADRRPLVQALDDDNVPERVKEVIRHGNILTDCVFDAGELVRANKADIIRHLLQQREGGPAFTLEELYDRYRAFLADHGLGESGRLDPTGLRAFGALLDRMSFAMYAKTPADEEGNRRGIRYYDSETKDFSPLENAIAALAEGADIEVSAEALMAEPSLEDVLASLDIRNGYELHQVLYAWCPSIPRVCLGRVPMVTFGSGDRRRQILGLISEIGPVDVNTLAEEYGRRYGVRPTTFKANFLNGFEQYCRDGLYSYEVTALDEGQLATLRSILAPVGGWCSAATVRERFLSCYPSWAGELITTENMAKAGFSICGGLLVREGFDLHAAFADMIAATPSFCLGEGEFTEEVCSSSAFASELNKAIRRFAILEVRKGEYLSADAFVADEVPMTPEGFSSFVDGIVARMVPGRPYSVKSLRALGLMGELDAVTGAHGLGDFFEESVLSVGYVGGALKRTSVAFTSLFARTAGGFTVSDVIEWYVLRRGSLTVQQIVDILACEHGATASPTNIRFAVQRSSLELDAERDMALLPDGAELLEEGPELLPAKEPAEEAEEEEVGSVPEPEAEADDVEVAAPEAFSDLEEPIAIEPVAAQDDEPGSPGQSELRGKAALPAEPPAPEPAMPAAVPPFRGNLAVEGGLVISAETGDALLDGRSLELTPSEFALLATMAAAPGKLFTREELCDALFGDIRYADMRTVDSHIKNLRAKLGDDPRDPTWISTVHGLGYRFDAEVDASGVEGLEVAAPEASAEYASADGASRLSVDEMAHRVCLNGEEIALTRSEYQLLVCLAQAAPGILSRLELCGAVGIQATSDIDARGVDSHLKNLRKSLGDDARNPMWIGTAHGRGYFFLGVRLADADETAQAPLDAAPMPEAEPTPEPEVEVVQDELRSEIARLEAELAEREAQLAEKERLREEYRTLSRRIPELETDVRSYGFFQRSEKRAAQARLEEARARLESLKGEGSGMGLIRREAEELQDKLTGLRARLVD